MLVTLAASSTCLIMFPFPLHPTRLPACLPPGFGSKCCAPFPCPVSCRWLVAASSLAAPPPTGRLSAEAKKSRPPQLSKVGNTCESTYSQALTGVSSLWG